MTGAVPERAVVAEQILMAPEDVAARLAVSRDHVFKLMRAGDLPYVRIGRFYRVSTTDLDLFVTERRISRRTTTPVRLRLRGPRTPDATAAR